MRVSWFWDVPFTLYSTCNIYLKEQFCHSFWPTVLSVVPLVQCVVCRLPVCNVLYCGETVRPSEKVSEGVNRKPGSKSPFLGLPPYFYFWFRCYGHQDGRFCLIFARIAQQSVLDATNGHSSSKPCAYCRIVWLELKPDSGLFVCITCLRLKCC